MNAAVGYVEMHKSARSGRSLRVAKALTVFFALVCLAFSAQAVSFDCAKASTEVEKLICGDAELSKLDEEMAVAYQDALRNDKQPGSIRKAQQRWLKERNRCTDIACVKRAYETRFQYLFTSRSLQASTDGNKTFTKYAIVSTKRPRYGHCVDVKGPSNCGRFKSGKGFAVCEAFLRYLNSLTETPKCEVPIPPDFHRPDWEEVDVMQHLELAYQAEEIRFSRYSWHRTSDFVAWREKFLAEMQIGTIVPSIRKVRVKPLKAGKEITIIAYTRDREACRNVVRKISKGSYWSDVGYVHFLLPDIPGASLIEIPGAMGAMAHPTEMLLYAGRPYFIQEIISGIADTPAILISAFDPALTRPEESKYWVEDFCNFSPLNLLNSKNHKKSN